jgi:hypothetical protein
MHSLAARAALIGLLSLRQLGAGPHVAPADLSTHVPVEALWQQPSDLGQLDLFAGPEDVAAPSANDTFEFQSVKTSGFSPGYDVTDAAGQEWSVKLGPEAQTEVVASRLLWALGYHQPSVYYVPHWTLKGGPMPGPQAGARFRPKGGDLKTDGVWSWQRNPFVGTQPYRGLIVLMLLLNSTDLRNDNNIVYKFQTADDQKVRLFAVKDLGATFGETGIYRPQRNYVDGYEHEPFLVQDANGRVKFGYRGLHRELLKQVTAEDVRWVCGLLDRLSPSQRRDAFRAGGYSPDVTERYLAALDARVYSGLALPDTFKGDDSDFWANRQLRKGDALIHKISGLVTRNK